MTHSGAGTAGSGHVVVGSGRVVAGVETGGTTVRCAVTADPSQPGEVRVLPTTTPAETVAAIVAAVRDLAGDRPTAAIGLAAFGPLDLNDGTAGYGSVLATPKPGWRGTPLARLIGDALGAPVVTDTDVNAAALAEQRWGAGRGLSDVAYVTVGTGIGAGAVVGDRRLRGHRGTHPELGHIPVRRHPDDAFAGLCPRHRDCLEGMASGPAIRARWGRPGEDLGADTAAAVEVEAYYLAQLVAVITYALSPGCIVLGGGVAAMPGLLAAVRAGAADLVAGYLDGHPVGDPASDFVRPTGLSYPAGLVGALALAVDRVSDPGAPAAHAPDPSATAVPA